MTVLDLPAFSLQATTFRSARLIALPSPENSQTVRMRPDEFSQKKARDPRILVQVIRAASPQLRHRARLGQRSKNPICSR